MSSILITGGTGFIGHHLVPLLQREGYTIHVFTRKKEVAGKNGIRYFTWDPQTGDYDPRAFDGVTYILNLAGANVADKRWTSSYKKEIIDSRVLGIQLLANALKETPNSVQAVISASATGWYGSDTEDSLAKGGFTENDPAAESFLAQVCRQWEDAAQQFAALNKRLVLFRIGIVLHPDGGMMKELLKPLRFGLAPVLGAPGQVISWIHLDDLCRLMLFAIRQENMQGVYNAVTTTPVTNSRLVTAIAKSRKKFYIKIPVPRFALKMITGQFAEEITRSATVSGNKLANAGFLFNYTKIEDAVAAGAR